MWLCLRAALLPMLLVGWLLAASGRAQSVPPVPVNSSSALQMAMEVGTLHMIITEHLDARGPTGTSSLRASPVTHGTADVLSIQGDCATAFTDTALAPEVPEALLLLPDQCVVLADTTWLEGVDGPSVWLHNVHVVYAAAAGTPPAPLLSVGPGSRLWATHVGLRGNADYTGPLALVQASAAAMSSALFANCYFADSKSDTGGVALLSEGVVTLHNVTVERAVSLNDTDPGAVRASGGRLLCVGCSFDDASQPGLSQSQGVVYSSESAQVWDMDSELMVMATLPEASAGGPFPDVSDEALVAVQKAVGFGESQSPAPGPTGPAEDPTAGPAPTPGPGGGVVAPTSPGTTPSGPASTSPSGPASSTPGTPTASSSPGAPPTSSTPGAAPSGSQTQPGSSDPTIVINTPGEEEKNEACFEGVRLSCDAFSVVLTLAGLVLTGLGIYAGYVTTRPSKEEKPDEDKEGHNAANVHAEEA